MIELFNEDCMITMARYPDNHFDLAITSPPYNMKLRTNSDLTGYCSRGSAKEAQKKYANFLDDLPMDEYEKFLCDICSELMRISKISFFNIQMVTGNKPALFGFMGKMKRAIKEVIIWDKGHGAPAMNPSTLNSRYEYIIVIGDTPITRKFSDSRFERGRLDNLWNISRGNKPDIDHNAVYPLALPEKILSNFSCAGQKCIDPFMGTGTTGIACHYFGVDFVGCEIDKSYFDAAAERIDRETRQIDIFQGAA